MFTDKGTKIVVAVITLIMAFCSQSFAYRQTRIPLDNTNGVPFYINHMGDYCIDGFEVDSNGDIYIMAGEDTNILTVFSEGKLKYRRQYDEFGANQLYIVNDKLYVFDFLYKANNLFILNRETGDIIEEYPRIIENIVNSYRFRDTSLILDVFNYKEIINLSSKLYYVEYNLSGESLGRVKNEYNLPEAVYTEKLKRYIDQFLGMWNDLFLFWRFGYDGRLDEFWLQNEKGEIITKARVDGKLFREMFYENPNEHRKLRNDSLFVLGYDGTDALITEIPLSELFSCELKIEEK